LALYQIDIEKAIGTETWTNVYHVDAADNAAANTALNAIVAAERPLHATTVTFVLGRGRLAVPGSTGFVVTLNVLGTRTAAGSKLPLFNCAMIDFANGQARPARKYIRGGFVGTDIGSDYTWSSAVQTLMANYVTAIIAIAAMRDPKGRTLSAGAGRSLVGMHQLRRGNRRKPVI
jgi:hypothetical protein